MTIFHHTSNYQIRSAVAANQFYTSNAQELVQLIDGYLTEHHVAQRNDIAAVIVPHAGYVFSGKVAASAFAQINPERRYQHIFLIGSRPCAQDKVGIGWDGWKDAELYTYQAIAL